MKVSYNWLKEYIDNLPTPEEVGDLLTFHSFEIEGIHKIGDDTMIDVDVLPNRSSDCLSHIGIARELSAITDAKLKKDPLRIPLQKTKDTEVLDIEIEDQKLCPRFSAVVVEGVKVEPSADWLKERLETVGQKSINNIVDATNYVMFDLGQPLHAFDAEKFKKSGNTRNITVRVSKEGERITTLDGAEYELHDNLLITDGISGAPLGIAGVKGGKHAEVTEQTTDLVIEAAHFNSVHIRKTSKHLKLRTDASLRFENNPSPELTLYALEAVTKLILEIAGGEYVGTVDVYPKSEETEEVSVTVDETNTLLGTSLSEKQVEQVLKRLGFEYTKRRGNFTIKPPFERTDLNIKEDLIEEIGRIHGYRSVESETLPLLKQAPEINKRFYYSEKVRTALVGLGFSEVYTYTLLDEGEVELENPFTSDKDTLRSSLGRGLCESLKLNLRNAPLLGLDVIKIFELGVVFKKDKEYLELGIGILPVGKKDAETSQSNAFVAVKGVLGEALGVEIEGELTEGVFTINFDALIESLPLPQDYEPLSEQSYDISYAPLSQYPFVLRDIAVWTPAKTKQGDVLAVIEEKAGELLVNYSLFDQFEKEGRVSYAFHLVFQSKEKTLTDAEVNLIMDQITSNIVERGWEVR